MKSTLRRLGLAFVLATTLLTGQALLPTSGAGASVGDCDEPYWNVVGRFVDISGSSFNYAGRYVALRQESIFDDYSYARISTGYQSGDLVWIDRSIKNSPLLSQHPSTPTVEHALAGWKQCGPFSGSHSDMVLSWHYAVRACFRPVGGSSVCGAWNVDQ